MEKFLGAGSEIALFPQKNLDEDLDILWASKGGNVDLSKWSKDDTGLIPCISLQRKSFTETFW